MVYSHEVENMCCVAKGPNHGPAPIPEEGKWVKAKEIKDISGLTHGIGWCATTDNPKEIIWRGAIDENNSLEGDAQYAGRCRQYRAARLGCYIST